MLANLQSLSTYARGDGERRFCTDSHSWCQKKKKSFTGFKQAPLDQRGKGGFQTINRGKNINGEKMKDRKRREMVPALNQEVFSTERLRS